MATATTVPASTAELLMTYRALLLVFFLDGRECIHGASLFGFDRELFFMRKQSSAGTFAPPVAAQRRKAGQ